MAKSQNLQTSFASGELSPLILGRTDLEQYYKGAQTAEGVVIVPQGGVKRRPGTEFIESTVRGLTRQTAINPNMPNGGTAANINDGDDSTYGQTSSAGTVGTAGFTVAKYNLGATPGAFEFIDVRNCSLQYPFMGAPSKKYAANLIVQCSDTSTFITTTEIGRFEIDNQTSKTVRFRVIDQTGSSGKRYWRVITDLDGTAGFPVSNFAVRIGEFGFKSEGLGISESKLFDWEYGPDQSYLAALSPGNLRFFRAPHAGSSDTEHVADIVVPYGANDIMEVRAAQTEGVMLMFHEDHPPLRIIFDGTDDLDSFVSDNIPFTNVPQYDYDDAGSPAPIDEIQEVTFGSFTEGEQYQVDVEGVLSKTITYAGDSNADERSATAFNLQRNLQEMSVFGFTGVSVERTANHTYTITISNGSTKAFELFAGFPVGQNADTGDTVAFAKVQTGRSRREDVWSDTRGYPSIGVFHDGRLWLGGTKSKPQSLFASRPGDFFNFEVNDGADDDGIFITIDSRGLTNIVDINTDRGLQVFCSGAEFVVKGNTPATVIVEQQTRHGTFGLETQSIDGATLFVDQNGKTLRQFLYSFNEDAYTSADISVLSSQLINQPRDMAILPGTTTDDANWLFIINQDGTGAVLNTMRSQDINGFTRWTPYANASDADKKNEIKSCAAVGNELYMVVYREAANADYYDIERWSFDYLLESSIKTSVVGTGSDIDVSVGVRLQGYTVGVLADGNVLADREVGGGGAPNGSVRLTAEEVPNGVTREIEIGLNFPVTVKPMPLNTNPGTRGGQNTMKRKKIVRMNLRVYESAGVQIDGNDVPVRKLGESEDSPLNTPYTPRTGIIQDNNGGNGWDVEVVPEITVPKGTPFHLQTIQYEVESS